MQYDAGMNHKLIFLQIGDFGFAGTTNSIKRYGER